jgi:hypothetical protein
MSEQQEAFQRDMRRAYDDHEHWEEILAPWIGVQRMIDVDGLREVVETLVSTTRTEAIIERSFFLSRPPKSVVVNVNIPKEKP